MKKVLRRVALATFIVSSLAVGSANKKEAAYQLPLAPEANSKLLQGYDGPYGHKGKLKFAYDFQMAIGSPVRAARDGKVVAMQSSFADSTRKPGEENYIFLAHGDGTFARYYHLTTDGVFVKLGEKVSTGQVIGRSGDSGASAGPHLHFDVTKDCPEWGCQTVPVVFADSPENPLVMGKRYSGSK